MRVVLPSAQQFSREAPARQLVVPRVHRLISGEIGDDPKRITELHHGRAL
jgi:hypothetical protein